MGCQRIGYEAASPLLFVVDNDADVRESLQRLLDACGWDCCCFSSAEAALMALEQSQPFCILADLHMPTMDGIELKQALSAKGHPSPVVLMTGGLDRLSAMRASQAGIIEILIKPFDTQELQAAVLSAVRIQLNALARARKSLQQEVPERLLSHAG